MKAPVLRASVGESMFGVGGRHFVSAGLAALLLIAVLEIGTAGVMASSPTHSPIAIDGDSAFTPANGVNGGSGTTEDPYVISGWSITAAAWGDGISITNTQAYFVISGCVLSKGLDGVSFMNVAHGAVRDCVFKSGTYGILAQYSSDCSFSDNSIVAKSAGIDLFSCDSIEVSGNAIAASDLGIEIGDSTGIVLHGNVMSGGGVRFIGYTVEHWNTHQIDTTNLVNNKPVLYYHDASDLTVPAGAGQIILGNCVRMVISGQTMSRVTAGINLGFSSYNKVVGNSLDGIGWACIVLQNSQYNLISSNVVRGDINGILLLWSEWNTIEANTFLRKSGGLVLSNSHHSTVTGNVFDKASFGIYVEWSTDCTLNGNQLFGSSIEISGTGSQYWTTLSLGDDNVIDGKPVVFLKDQVTPVIPDVWSELILVSCSQASIENFSISNSMGRITLGYCSGIVIANLTESNSLAGIFAEGLTDSTIKDCVFDGPGASVVLYYCSNIEILRNQFVRNYEGLELYATGYSLVKDNLFQKNLAYAISINWESVGNVIYDNAFVANSWYAAHYGEPSQVYDYWGTTSWDFGGVGNYWSDWTSPDANGDGIVDSPYVIAGTDSAADHFPLVSSPLK